MSRFIVLFLLIAATLPAETITLRVLSYNLHHGEGMDGRIDLERIARVIRSVDPDIVGLQEVDVRTKRSGGVDQALVLAQLTGMHVVYGATMPYQDGLYGNAVLSRWPAADFSNFSLPPNPGHEPRALLAARFGRLPFPGPAHNFAGHVYVTHLDIHREDRLNSLERILKATNTEKGLFTGFRIFMGDFNDTPDSELLRSLHDVGWRSAVTGPTSPVVDPKRQIDYILFHPPTLWRVREQRVLEEEVASDHRPIFAVLEFDMPAPSSPGQRG
jgi:endonuclease/exonuclease/phosphatase family metal-dependent hydrolase